ncbi:MG2 domain-containing protein [Treponema primitia]|uniref:alpha-2-macroglobulin family protein n=1 Tax=Treponema primitia TaxID=88058 RepID=UPI000C1F9F08|nr:MG2 domain-containing protein [Treponema primitia]
MTPPNNSNRFYRFSFPALTLFCAALTCLVLSACGKDARAGGPVTVFSGTAASAGRIPAELAEYRIAYYEAIAAAETEGSGGLIQESDEPFTIVDYGPRGDLPSEIKKPSIYVVFSQPVVPLSRLGAPIRDGKAFFTVEPAMEGVYRWYGSRLLAFEPDAESLPQRRYTVTISDRLQSLGGKRLTGERSFSFETERLSLLTWSLGTGEQYVFPWDVGPEDGGLINLIFSYPVNLTEIMKWIEIRGAGRTWPFTVSRPEIIKDWGFLRGRSAAAPEQGVRLSLRERLPPDTDVEIRILAGARSEADWLGSKEEQRESFHTLRPFRFGRYSVRTDSNPRTQEGDTIPISLDFTHGIDPEGVENYFSIDGIGALKKENIHVYGDRVILNRLPLEYQHEYTVRIAAELKDLWGRQLGQAQVIQVKVGDANSYVYIRNTGSKMLEAGFPPMIVWEAQNPVSLKRRLSAARGPYDRADPPVEDVDPDLLPRNSKRYFMEDLSPFLGSGGKGSAALSWDYATRSSWEAGRVYRNSAWLSVQVTDLGVTTRYGYNRALVWVTRLSTGEPVAGARVELLEGTGLQAEGRTNTEGLAVFSFSDGEFVRRFSPPETSSSLRESAGKGLRIRVVENGGAQAGGDELEFVPNDSHNLWRFGVDSVTSPFRAEEQLPMIFLFTDRGLYRPGETLTFRGIDRSLTRGQYQPYQGKYSVEILLPAGGNRTLAVLDGVSTGTGGSSGIFELPAELEPGQYVLRYTRLSKEDPGVKTLSFQVANFERLRVEGSVSFPDLPFYQGETLTGKLSASYLAGGALTGAPYSFYWTREPAAFNPGGNWQYWHFGPENNDGRSFLSRGEGNLGPQGSADISLVPQGDGVEGAVYRYRLEGSVQDAGRQEIASRNAVTVHPASFYIAARLDTGTMRAVNLAESKNSAYFLAAGSPATVSWALVNAQGESYRFPENGKGELAVQFVRHEWKQSRQAGIGGRVNLLWERVETVVEERTVRLTTATSGVLNFTPDQGGQWELRLRSRDARDRPVVTRLSFYVSGAGWVRWGSADADAITLRTDKQIYAPGETAKLLVQSPLPKGKYLLTLEREGIFSEKIIDLDGSARTIDIPIEESYVPIVYAAISSYTIRSGAGENSYYEPDLDKPKGIFGLAAIYVDNASRHYQIEIQPGQGVYGPGDDADVRLRVTLGGKPVSGVELSFMAVDRGVVDLINYHVPDPLAFFYDPNNFPLGVRGADSRSLLIDPVTYALSDLQGGDAEDESKLEERKDFRPTAVFEPYLLTGPDGTVMVRFSLPDSLTTYRCTAVAVGQEAGFAAFGIQERDLRVSAPMTALIAAPRKLRWRDTAQVSLILTNLENTAAEAKVSLEIEDLSKDTPVLVVDGTTERTLNVQPGESLEAPFRVAAVGSGRARLIFTLRSPKVNERIIREIDIDRPRVYETVTVMGNLGEAPFIEEGVVIGGETGTLSVSLAASRLAMLKDAVGYLLDYPYGCLEQRTARLLPLIAFGDSLAALQLDSPVTDVRKTIEDELALLAKNKLSDGSYPYWPGNSRGDYFVTLRVGHIAALAKEKGYAVPGGIDIPRLLTFLSSSESARYHLTRDPFLQGYSLWVRAMLGERVGSELRTYLNRGDELGISGMSFAGLTALALDMKDLATTARDRVRRYIRPQTRSLDITDTAESRIARSYWNRETDKYALALMLYQSLNPKDDMTTRLANALIDKQRRGQGRAGWSDTAASFWAVLAFGWISDTEALDAAPRTAGETSLQNARVSLGGHALFSADFEPKGGVPVSRIFSFTEPPLAGLERNTLFPLRIEREAAAPNAESARGTSLQVVARLYYTASLRYGIPAELAGVRDEGLGVFVETLDADGRPVTDGRLTAGKVYTRRVVISSPRARSYVAVRVPVPSGAEIVDASFVSSGTIPPDNDTKPERDYWTPYEQPPLQFIFDDEVRFHWDQFPQGKKEAVFRFRAVMPGVYPTPPAEAECMYEGEVFGRAPGELIVIR